MVTFSPSTAIASTPATADQGLVVLACGGTHVHHTGEIGRFSVFKIENNGLINKRFCMTLEVV